MVEKTLYFHYLLRQAPHGKAVASAGACKYVLPGGVGRGQIVVEGIEGIDGEQVCRKG